MPQNHPKGFTLAELLIALAILGVIATFTIPKVLNSQADTKWKAIAKEGAATLSGAFSAYKQTNSVSGSMSTMELAPYLNYVKVQTTGTIDGAPNDSATYSCSAVSYKCLKLHNGSVMMLYDVPFGGTQTNRVIWALLDPDGVTTSVAGKESLWFALYNTGKITSWANIDPGSTDNSGSTFNPNPANDPAWFNWN